MAIFEYEHFKGSILQRVEGVVGYLVIILQSHFCVCR